MDAATIYANVRRRMKGTSGGRNSWKPITIICFPEPDIDGDIFNGERPTDFLFHLAPNIKNAFESLTPHRRCAERASE